MAKTKSSRRWLREHFNDRFVQAAQKSGYRARSAYKLIEIQEKDRLIKSASRVLDLGAAPGGWCQVVTEHAGDEGVVIAVDLLEMPPLAGVEIVMGDFTAADVQALIFDLMGQKAADLVLSDMAPNMTGNRVVDQARSMVLVESVLSVLPRFLRPGGSYLVKIFEGTGTDVHLKSLRACFDRVIVRKPEASRSRSSEIYYLAKGYRPGKAVNKVS